MASHLSDVANQVFNYVIIGSGTAGLTVAARLSEIPDITVAVLEAGSARFTSENEYFLAIPQLGKSFGNPEYDWLFQTSMQQHVDGKPHFWSRGKVLGGSSAVNFMGWNKPSAWDVASWEKLGNPDWTWKTFSRLSKNVEIYTVFGENFRSLHNIEHFGSSGPTHLTPLDPILKDDTKVYQALRSAGLPHAKEPFNGDPIGVFYAPVSVEPSSFTRSNAFTAYYLPNKDRPNLKVLCNAEVNRVVGRIDSSSGEYKASGVMFEYGGATYIVKAGKEVIVSAGTIKSPQVLELFRIGNQSILEPLGIETLVDLPGVGENVQERISSRVIFELDPNSGTEMLDILSDAKTVSEQLELHAQGKGLFCRGLNLYAMVPLATVTETLEDANDMISRQRERIKEQMSSGEIHAGLKAQYEIQLSEYESNHAGNCELACYPGYIIRGATEKGKSYISFLAALGQPFSRGTIHVKSADLKEQPVIDPHYLEQGFDLKVLVEVVKFAHRLSTHESFKAFAVKEVMPGPAIESEEDLQQYIKNTLATMYYTTGSLSMLPREYHGVVDSRLRVYGTKNVRIVDLSIVPLTVAAHVQSIAFTIAEQVAEFIKSDYVSQR